MALKMRFKQTFGYAHHYFPRAETGKKDIQ
jgi:hypothetical protein